MTLPEPRTLLVFTLLIAGALASSFLLVTNSDDATVSEKPVLSLAYYLNDAELTGTADDGSVLYRIRAGRAEQNTVDASIEMQSISMNYGPADGLAWDVSADTGRIMAQAEIIELAGNVLAITADQPANRTEIRTQRLDINPDTMRASTPAPVAVLFNGNQLNGTGMEADFKTNRLSLLANVNGKFAP